MKDCVGKDEECESESGCECEAESKRKMIRDGEA